LDWRKFLTLSTQHLTAPILSIKGPGCSEGGTPGLRSWCSWTTFGRLGGNAGYWTGSLPKVSELEEGWTIDGGTWSQPFHYDDLAHLIIPRHFEEEYPSSQAYFMKRTDLHNAHVPHSPGFWMWTHTQDIDGLSELLKAEGIAHQLSDWVLEVKLY
jgi:hypothetical protein